VGEGSMAFMFESSLMVGVTEWGLSKCKKVQTDYNAESWEPLKPHFKRPQAKVESEADRDKGAVGDEAKVLHSTS